MPSTVLVNVEGGECQRGELRNVPSADINTEDFSAAVDFLGL